jgi:hypothetical protein
MRFWMEHYLLYVHCWYSCEHEKLARNHQGQQPRPKIFFSLHYSAYRNRSAGQFRGWASTITTQLLLDVPGRMRGVGNAEDSASDTVGLTSFAFSLLLRWQVGRKGDLHALQESQIVCLQFCVMPSGKDQQGDDQLSLGTGWIMRSVSGGARGTPSLHTLTK